MSGYSGIKGDNRVLRGIGAIVNRDQTAQNIDLDEIERALAAETPINKSQSQIDRANAMIHELSREFGVVIDDALPPGMAPPAQRSPSARSMPATSTAPSYGYNQQQSGYGGGLGSMAVPPTPTVLNNYGGGSSGYGGGEDDEDDHAEGESPYSRANIGGAIARPPTLGTRASPYAQREYIDDIETRDRVEDEKASMLADIEELIEILEVGGMADLSRINRVDQSSSYKEIECVLRILQKKLDRARCSTFAEELFLFGALALEEIFDGENVWLGYRPDLTGFRQSARQKLRRVRHETGQIVSYALQNNSIGPGMRMLMEMVPAMILCAHKNSQQHGQPGMFDDSSMAETNSRLADG